MTFQDLLFHVFWAFEIGFELFDLGLADISRDIFYADVQRIHRRNLHSDLVSKGLKFVGLGNEARFTVDFDDSTEATIVNISVNQTFAGFTVTAFFGFSQAFFSHGFERFVEIAICFNEGFFSIGKSGARKLF